MEKYMVCEIIEKFSSNRYCDLSVNAKYLYLVLFCESSKMDNSSLELTNQRVRELLSVSNKTAVNVLKELECFGLITKFKNNKNTNFVKLRFCDEVEKTVKLVRFSKILYKNVKKNTCNYDWLKLSYERFGM